MIFPTEKNYVLTFIQLHPKRKRPTEYSAYITPSALNSRSISYDMNDNLFGNGFLNADFSSYSSFQKSSLYRVFQQFSEKEFESAQTMLNNLGDELTLDYLKRFFEIANISFITEIGYARMDKKTDDDTVYYDYNLGIIADMVKSGETECASLKSIYDEVTSTKFALKSYQFQCHDLKELLCAELYFYLSEGFKFKVCKHCGQLFPTKNTNIDYCNRNSPIEKYSHLKCVEAQQRIRKNSGANHPLKKRFNVLCSTLDRLIIQDSSPITEEDKRIFLDTAKYIRETKTDDEYSEWLFEQEKKYKTRTKKAYLDKEKDGVKNGNNK